MPRFLDQLALDPASVVGFAHPTKLPTADLGLREAVRIFYKLSDRPKVDELKRIAEPWTPYRSVATWYMWRGLHLERGD